MQEKETQQMTVSSTGGLRDNKGKPHLACVPASLETAVSRVIYQSSNKGGGKYPMNNWRKGMSWNEVGESALRHLKKWLQEGKDLDEESKLNHLWHVATNIAFLIEYAEKNVGEDDRYKGE